MKNWFEFRKFRNTAGDASVVSIIIYGEIGDWWTPGALNAKDFAEQLAALSPSVKTLEVRINSPGGNAYTALACGNLLREQRSRQGRKVDGYVDGIAASAASVFVMGCGTVNMADGSLMFVHNPHAIVAGEAADLRKSADALDQVRAQLIAAYRWHSKQSEASISALLNAGTWMNADEAIAKGFATAKVAAPAAVAAASVSEQAWAALKVPDKYRGHLSRFVRQAGAASPTVRAPKANRAPAPAAPRHQPRRTPTTNKERSFAQLAAGFYGSEAADVALIPTSGRGGR